MFAYEILQKVATREESLSGNYSKDTALRAMIKYHKHRNEIMNILINEKPNNLESLINKLKKLK